ncbi:MAG: type II toxin-antitoxin system RelE/ParE family toxin [Acidimicrobiia bacterium]|nr:type II toxin-antitoxin system RelE/ParE family toxin [Acidimicrobiia bacterium]MCY4432134.1 type II toxin-antitoxin system RelE/ParE family toxin [bacterium]
MSRHRVEIARQALKSIARLPRREQQRVRAAVDLLAEESRPPSCVALTGEESAYRVRVGDYRILYEVIDARLVIQAIRVGHCRDVYQPR